MEKDIISALKEMGLSEEEARVYSALLSREKGAVGDISQATGYSRTKTYGIMDRLFSKGWLEVVDDNPKTYQAVDPKKVLSMRKKSVLSAYKMAIKELIPKYIQRDSGPRTYKGVDVMKKIQDMMKNAKREVYIMLSFIPNDWFKSLERRIGDLKKKHINVKCILPSNVSAEIRGRLNKISELRIKDVPNAGIIVIDDDEVMIGGMEEQHKSMLVGIWTKNREMIRLCKIFFRQIYGGENYVAE